MCKLIYSCFEASSQSPDLQPTILFFLTISAGFDSVFSLFLWYPAQ